MTGPGGPRGTATLAVPAGAGLLEKLLAAVRPHFWVEVFLPDPAARVLGRPECLAPGCDRSGWEHGL